MSALVEKGGKETVLYISTETYHALERHIAMFGKLESNYSKYVAAINLASHMIEQFSLGRGSMDSNTTLSDGVFLNAPTLE